MVAEMTPLTEGEQPLDQSNPKIYKKDERDGFHSGRGGE